jgi:chorismate mutase
VVDEQHWEIGVASIGAGHLPHGSVAETMADQLSTPDAQLAKYRASIDNIDAALVHLLAERFKITQDVGRYKAAVGLPPADPEREEQQVARLRALAVESGLDPVFSEKFLRFIVAEVIHHHQRHAEQEPGIPD